MQTEQILALTTDFAELAADIRGSSGPDEVQGRRIGRLAVRHVSGCRWSSISDLHSGRGRSLGASDPVAAYLDHLQYEIGEGPCLQTASTGARVLSADLLTEQRWPRFVARARGETPLRSALFIRLPGRESAVMSFYAGQVNAFDDDAILGATILVAHAAGLLALAEATERSHHLEEALASSRQIGMAIGVLMAHHKITQEDAFTLLRTASQVLHRKLRDIARDVTETGCLPALPRRLANSRPLAVDEEAERPWG